ncbi:hypothetical protein MUK42_04860 [Musa troglodytarum]|uniref:Uncharacterized protein n=1 Tax=Musa troglodytarum TaxID=320322 RepID=A0A9E7G7H3_9LILI|nr:hypothetical protein MUK42_04860 [Musa troglodytarum]
MGSRLMLAPTSDRREFERANMEAMDESAEWRMRYDVEVDRSRQIQDELLKVKASLAGASRRFSMLQKLLAAAAA